MNFATLILLASAFAGPPLDAGIATSITGQANITPNEGSPSAVVPFQKVRVGDAIVLSEGANLQLVYFSNGRRETWTGPVTLSVGPEAAVDAKGKGAKNIAHTPIGVGKALTDLPVLIKRAELDRPGQLSMRRGGGGGGSGKKQTRTESYDREEMAVPEHDEVTLDEADSTEVAAAQAHYQKMRASSGDTDILPEIYLATVYLTYGMDEQAKEMLQEAQKRCPKCDLPDLFID